MQIPGCQHAERYKLLEKTLYRGLEKLDESATGDLLKLRLLKDLTSEQSLKLSNLCEQLGTPLTRCQWIDIL